LVEMWKSGVVIVEWAMGPLTGAMGKALTGPWKKGPPNGGALVGPP